MPKSKWKEIERELKRGGVAGVYFDGKPYVQSYSRPNWGRRIPIRTWRKMWALARNNTHPIINQRTVIL